MTMALVFRSRMHVPPGVHFYTSEENPFQVGIHNRTKGTKLPPHIHRIENPITLNVIQELLCVVSGKIRVTIYTTEGKPCGKMTLSGGDNILLMNGGHSVEFLTKTKVFEIKQGPYSGPSHAKIYIHTL